MNRTIETVWLGLALVAAIAPLAAQGQPNNDHRKLALDPQVEALLDKMAESGAISFLKPAGPPIRIYNPSDGTGYVGLGTPSGPG
jgi:hypothetical protein